MNDKLCIKQMHLKNMCLQKRNAKFKKEFVSENVEK